MKRFFLSLFFLLPMALMAQVAPLPQPQARFGYLSYKAVYEQMPEYAQAKASFVELKKKYEAEATRSEDEFQRKFAEFLHGQTDFPASIMQKRQTELQELMEKSTKFRRESNDLLRKAEADLHQPILQRLNDAIQAVGTSQGLMYILNTDGNTLPFINPHLGVNVTDSVLVKLGIKEAN